MTARVKVGGQYLDRLGPVSEIVDSTVLRADGFSGDFESSCVWAVERGFTASWFRRGAVYEVIERGGRSWGGILAEPEVTDAGLALHADGFGALGADWPAIIDAGGGTLVPSTVADAVLDYAATVDCPLQRLESISATALGTDDGVIGTVSGLVTRVAALAGKRWWVDSYGGVRLVLERTVPTHTLIPRQPYLGTADDAYASHLYGYYVSSVNVDGEPDGWSLVVTGDDQAADQFGRRSVTVDLTPLGLISGATAQAHIDGRFAQVGGRMGFTDSIELTTMNVRRLGAGWDHPLSMRAGDRIRVPGVTDRTQPSTRAALEVTLGELVRFHDEQRAVGTPIGFVARDFAGAIAAATPPPSVTAV